MKVLLINDSTSNPNWGDRAAASAMKMMLSQLGAEIIHSISEADLFRTSLDGYDPSGEFLGERSARDNVKRFIPPVALELRRKVVGDREGTLENALIPANWEAYQKSAEVALGNRTPWPKLMRAMADMDVAVINGDASMVGNNVHPRTLLFLSFLIKKHFDKPAIMVNHTADFDHPDLRRVAEQVYPLFDDVVFRDRLSVERCKTFCSGRFAADTGFWFRPAPRATWAALAGRATYFDVWPDTARFDPSRPYLCVGGSSLFGAAGAAERIVNGYELLVEHLQSLYPGQIVMTASDKVDLPMFRLIARRFSLPLIGPTPPVQQVVDIVGNADAYIGGRWHPSIFALSGGTPIVALSAKTFKMKALAEMAGLPSSTFSAIDLGQETEGIGRLLLSYLEEGQELRNRLRTWADEMAENTWDNLAYLRRFETRAEVPGRAGS